MSLGKKLGLVFDVVELVSEAVGAVKKLLSPSRQRPPPLPEEPFPLTRRDGPRTGVLPKPPVAK